MTNVLDALLDSWDRNNIITTNLLRLVPDDAIDIKPIDGSPSIGQLFTHLHYVPAGLRLRRCAGVREAGAER